MYGCLEFCDVSENVLETKNTQRYFMETHAAKIRKHIQNNGNILNNGQIRK